MSLPDWNMAGVIPPVRPDSDPAGAERSPYKVGLSEFSDRFATSAERTAILKGFVELRRELQLIGLVEGFQWIDGSFLENVEDTENRAPNDIDVVTYAILPAGHTQKSFLPILRPYLDRAKVKEKYKVDHFLIFSSEITVPLICYWYSLWSHRRDGMWKGFAEIDLDPANNEQAAQLLADKINGGFGS